MFLNSLDISGSGLTAQRLRMDIISQNIANQDTSGTPDSDPYTRQMVVFQEKELSFGSYLNGETGISGGGVQVSAVVGDTSDYKLVYDPTNANANADGYVEYPNVDTVTEITDMLEASKSYNADIQAFNAVKGILSTALEIGR